MKVAKCEDLEKMVKGGCKNPNCQHKTDEVWIHSRCHPYAGLYVRYVKGSSELNVICAECEKPIVDILVGS